MTASNPSLATVGPIAVELITPPFECGPTSGPVTVFVVAIASEDGCFLSGRHSRFEFGHLYPLSARDMQIDTSPVCIAVGRRKHHDTNKDGYDDDVTASDCAVSDDRNRSASKTQLDSSSDDDNSRSSSSDNPPTISTMRCLCKFDSGDPLNPEDRSSIGDDEDPVDGSDTDGNG